MAIYGNYLFTEADKDEPNRAMSGHAYKEMPNDKKYKDALNKYNKDNNMDELDKQANGLFGTLFMNNSDKTKLNRSRSSDMVLSSKGTTSQGKDIMDSEMRSRIESFDKKRAEEILKSQDIVTEYNAWIKGEVDEIIKLANEGEKEEEVNADKGNIRYVLESFTRCMEDAGMSKKEIGDYIAGKFFYQSDNPTNIKLLLNLRIRYCEHITFLLKELARENYKLLGYSKSTLNDLLNKLDEGDVDTIKNIRKTLADNADAFLRGDMLDLSSVHAGKIYLSDSEDRDLISATGYARGDKDNKTAALDQLLQKAFKYKAIMLCHGGSQEAKYFKSNEKVTDSPEAASFVQLCKENGYTEDEINDYYSNDKEVWIIQPVTINGKKIQIVDWAIAEIYLGSKGKDNTILLEQCNPGGHKIHPVFHKVKGLKVTYSDFSNYIESADELDFDSVEMSLNESESDLRYMAEFYGIDYDSIDTNNINLDEESIEELDQSLDEFDRMLEQVIMEGKFTDAIKEFAKKAVETVIAIFKKLWEIVKGFFNKIKDFFKGNKEAKEKLPEPVTISLITMEAAGTKDFEVSTQSELERIALDNIKKIEREINRRQDEQVKATKELDDFVQKQPTEEE